MIDQEQFKTPLFDAMVSLAESRKVSFHTPGHKSGKGISTRFRKFVGPKIFSIDLTTLDEVDSLQKPKGVIKEAQELAAKAYGADRSFFLVNGTTGGNHAMILAACGPRDKVLVARNAHKSVLAGLIFSGAEPIFFSPAVDDNLKLTLNVTYETTLRAIDAHPEAKALFLTSPNYYGICADLERIIPYAHSKGLVVMVDEAHGPHLKFHPDLPISGVEAGADLVVQSTHKIIGGMTQASMLHAQGPRVDMTTLAQVLRFVQSTSPSYILMASLDLARMQMATEGEKLLDKAIKLAAEARSKINRIPGVSCFDKAMVKNPLFSPMGDFDITKLTITVRDLGLTGYQASQILNNKYHIQVEMADPFNVLVIVSIGDRRDDLNRLVDALRDMSKEYHGKPSQSSFIAEVSLPPFGKAGQMTPREAFFRDYRYAPLDESGGLISSEIITVYPPGIPLLVPGEIVTQEVIDYIRKMDRLGATVDGLNASNSTIAVVKQ
ncbi:MAG: aminotransferase class I/II-fold pyridoxal phosphate-dependent enzyme [Candidatus Manganitrophus sp. SB1]|nr:aminotransferase class I/II-fold pyridoxal phosphate-dependent enzyme [Candidatus Manganitrophus morganii]